MAASFYFTFGIPGFENVELNFDDLNFDAINVPPEGIHPVLLPLPQVKLDMEGLSKGDKIPFVHNLDYYTK